jgi:hypothetical protein
MTVSLTRRSLCTPRKKIPGTHFCWSLLQESDAHSFLDHEGILLTAFQPQGQTVNADSYYNILRKLRKAIQRKRPGKSPPGSDSSPKNFMLPVFRGLWNDGTSASMYRKIMLRNKSIFQISTLVCLSCISISNLLIDLSTYLRGNFVRSTACYNIYDVICSSSE